jgi:hypothetical protein
MDEELASFELNRIRYALHEIPSGHPNIRIEPASFRSQLERRRLLLLELISEESPSLKA